MLIRFGLHLDGMQPHRPSTALGAITVGPLGLLGVLETQLGLPPVVATPADVLMAYRGCLAECDRDTRFYHASFAVDPINVGRALLAWRAQLYEHGWDGTFAADAPARLRDLGAVEALAASRVPLNRGQRAQRAAAALADARLAIERVVLLDELEDLPRAWRELLARLGAVQSDLSIEPSAPASSDLRAIQDRLRVSDASVRRTRLRGDGSVVVVRGASRDITAQAVAEALIADGSRSADALLIAERDGIVLDNALERAGLPRAGFQHASRFRAVTQVLKLAIALLWRPVSPNLLLQFLIHPVGPLSRRVRDALADAVAAQPGIGGGRWCAALEDIETRLREDFGATPAEIAATQKSIDAWLGGARYEATPGAPIEAIAQRAQLCSKWLGVQLGVLDDDTERVLYAGALAQAEALLRALHALVASGQTHLRRIELDRLVDEVAGTMPDPNTFAEAQHVRAATDPASVTEPWRCVYWWDMAPPPREVGLPWSRKELAWLRERDVAPFDADRELRNRARRWLRPILNAQEKLVLVVHDSERGDHPLWTQLSSLFDGFVEVRADDALLQGRALDALRVPARRLTVKPLPAPRRWWQLGDDAPIPKRPVESYSSLSKLFDWPHGYVLRYAAKLYPGRAEDLADGNRLYGNLAHRLLERYFADNPLWSMLDSQGLREWFASEFPTLVETEAAQLLEPGRGIDKQYVATTLERALVSLVDHLRDAGIVAVQPEAHAESAHGTLRVAGAIDLLLTDPQGREIVLDVKWAGEKFRAEELRENRHLQLTTYAYLRRARKRWPALAFFIVESGHVLARDASVFSGAVVCRPANDESTEALWQRVVRSYDWRWKQLARGAIEVNTAHTEPDEASVPPIDALVPSEDPDRFDDFVNLTGWADHQ